MQQLDAEDALERRQPLADQGARDAEMSGSGLEAASLDHRHERLHAGDPIHRRSDWQRFGDSVAPANQAGNRRRSRYDTAGLSRRLGNRGESLLGLSAAETSHRLDKGAA